MFKLNRDYYLNLVQEKGISAAITALHSDTREIEHESFEGTKGYQPDLIAYLEEVRTFSRELWNIPYQK
jgi:hypothetical protein